MREEFSFLRWSDRTAHRWTIRLWNGFAGERCADRKLKIVMIGLRALLTESDVTVVDAAVINLVEFFALYQKDRDLRRDGRMGESYEDLTMVDYTDGRNGKIVEMFHDSLAVVLGVGIHPPEAHSWRGKLSSEAYDFGNFAVRDGAIGGSEVEYDNANTRIGKESRGTGRIGDYVRISLGERSMCGKDHRNDSNDAKENPDGHREPLRTG